MVVRTALINQIPVVLLERGIIAPQRRRKLDRALVVLLDEADGVGPELSRLRALVADMRAEWAQLDRCIAAYHDEFAAVARCRRPAPIGPNIWIPRRLTTTR